MTNPDCLIMDEPSEGLAPIIIQGLWEAIGRLRAEGLSILLVEQNASLAVQLVDYVHNERPAAASQGRRDPVGAGPLGEDHPPAPRVIYIGRRRAGVDKQVGTGPRSARPRPLHRVRCRSRRPIWGHQRASRWWLIGRSEDRTGCKIVIIWRLSAVGLVARNIWTPRRNFAV
jgi:hypothetical protein